VRLPEDAFSPAERTAFKSSKPFQRKILLDGSSYVGHLDAEGEPHGWGNAVRAKWNNPQLDRTFGESAYSGEWFHGLQHGLGRLSYFDRGRGMWLARISHFERGTSPKKGTGTKFACATRAKAMFGDPATFGKDDVSWRYEGGLRENGMLHGQGRKYFSDGSWAEGRWVDNAMEGEGETHLADGSTYVGGFVRGLMQGLGTMTIPIRRKRRRGRAQVQPAEEFKTEQGYWAKGRKVADADIDGVQVLTPEEAYGLGDCAACLEPLHGTREEHEAHGPVVKTSCGHSFHAKCMLEWLGGSGSDERTCPLCRADVKTLRGVQVTLPGNDVECPRCPASLGSPS